MPEEEPTLSLETINVQFAELLKQREKVEEPLFVTKLKDLCDKLPPKLRVIFEIRIGMVPETNLDQELRDRLEMAGVLDK